MPIENEILPYFSWLPSALLSFGIAISVLLILGTIFSYLSAAIRLGPSEAFYLVAKIIIDALPEFALTSPRRVYALARLAVQESVRRRVIVVFAVFVIILLFAGWYLDTESNDPARLYISFVLTTTNFLMLLLGFMISTFSLPADLKSRTMYTITTKPVYTGEIVLGRFLGFGFVGTVLILLMCGVSYVFVVRGLSHAHQVDGALAVIESPIAGRGVVGEEGITTFDKHHRHEITLNTEGVGRTDTKLGHWHEVTKDGDKLVIGPPQGDLEARVPLAGKLSFLDRAGKPADKGINVGNEWMYRSYIEGDTLAAAIWTFDNVTPGNFPDGLPVEMTIRVFRSHKGDIEQGIGGTLQLINPDPGAKIRRSEKIFFTAQEFNNYQKLIPREVKAVDARGKTILGADGKPALVDIFEDLAYEGQVQVELKCTDPAQYFGVAQRDLYLHAADNLFITNFAKGYFDLWLQMMIAIAFGVMFSTFLSGPVAMLSALACMVVGFVAQFIFDLASGSLEGGGPIESTIRLFTQKNLSVDLEIGKWPERFIKAIDFVMMQGMQGVASLLPNYKWFDSANYVAYGMNISGDAVAQHASLALAYCLVALVVGYFFLKTREIAAD
ncbi:MAG TPA: ABC transporter permease [Pirellulaceae bacterium]|nr:ABC transporter permease [Pirellulaceae bacterium]